MLTDISFLFSLGILVTGVCLGSIQEFGAAPEPHISSGRKCAELV